MTQWDGLGGLVRDDHDLWTMAQRQFEDRDPAGAARTLRSMPAVSEGTAPLAVRLLLARALFASAQLHRAETELRRVVAEHPTEAYAHLLLGRTRQRLSRPEEAATSLRLAEVLEPGITGS
ncbi:tetratricopeptide repeat protein [Kineococcus gynurae]|uniref:Tetratricopeptide repeat protein n=1 Tax=Kineococcus gynurae TaxID=452979 RepID=A0ABV5LP41_9ACTN